MQQDVKILSRRGNVTVLLLPDRKFPAVAMQGDSLIILRQDIEDIIFESKKNNLSTISDMATDVFDKISSIVDFYEEICKINEFGKPY